MFTPAHRNTNCLFRTSRTSSSASKAARLYTILQRLLLALPTCDNLMAGDQTLSWILTNDRATTSLKSTVQPSVGYDKGTLIWFDSRRPFPPSHQACSLYCTPGDSTVTVRTVCDTVCQSPAVCTNTRNVGYTMAFNLHQCYRPSYSVFGSAAVHRLHAMRTQRRYPHPLSSRRRDTCYRTQMFQNPSPIELLLR